MAVVNVFLANDVLKFFLNDLFVLSSSQKKKKSGMAPGECVVTGSGGLGFEVERGSLPQLVHPNKCSEM